MSKPGSRIQSTARSVGASTRLIGPETHRAKAENLR